MADVFPVDYTTDVGRVRKYIPDVVQLPDPKDLFAADSFMWTDEAIQSFINDEIPLDVTVAPRTVVWRAAAYIMIATANNEALILKKLVTEDLSTDGPAVAKALLLAADALIDRAAKDETAGDFEEIFIEVPYIEHKQYPRSVWGL
jgi:hypothetical protein